MPEYNGGTKFSEQALRGSNAVFFSTVTNFVAK